MRELLGDVVIGRTRRGPPPDPTKCHQHDQIGVFLEANTIGILRPWQSSNRAGWVWAGPGVDEVRFASPAVFDRWFWVSEPPPITWTETSRQLAKGAHPIREWAAVAEGVSFSIQEWIAGSVTMSAEYRLFSAPTLAELREKETKRVPWSHLVGDFSSLTEAQREVAMVVRDLRTHPVEGSR